MGLKKVVYKPVPWIYHEQPSEEDLYAIVEVFDVRITRSLSTTISREQPNTWYRIRKSGAEKALQAGVVIEETEDYQPFWKILSANLQERYSLKPVHTLDEIMLLHERFPEQIRLFVAKEDCETIGGCVLYLIRWFIRNTLQPTQGGESCMHSMDCLSR